MKATTVEDAVDLYDAINIADAGEWEIRMSMM